VYDRPRAYAPDDRVLRWISTVSVRYPRGIPVERFVRHLKADLAPLTFAQLDGALRILEVHGLIKREWDSPGDFRVLITDAGTQQAKLLEEPGPAVAAVPPAATSPPPFVAAGRPPPSAAPAPAPYSTGYLPPTATAGPQVPGAVAGPAGTTYRPVPISPGTAMTPPAPRIPSVPEPMPSPVSSLAGPVQGRSAGPIPARGPPTAANLPVRIILYLLLYGASRGEEFPVVPGEDLARYLLNQGFMLSEDFLGRLFTGLQSRDLLSYTPRSTGGYDLQLSPRGHQLAEGLLEGHVTLRSPDGSPPSLPTSTGPQPTKEELLEDRWAAAEVANTDLRKENEALKAALSDSEARRKEERETLDETLHQMELQDVKLQELQEMVARMPKAGLPLSEQPAADPASAGDPPSTDPPPASTPDAGTGAAEGPASDPPS
jgi:hypothetical protein